MHLQELLDPKIMFEIPIFGITIPVTDTIVVMWIVMAFLMISAVIFTRKLKLIPEGKQNFAETVVELINSFAKGNVGHHWRHFAPYLGTVLLFLVFSNTISIFNIIPSGEWLAHVTHIEFFEKLGDFGLRPPTRDVNVTAAFAIMSVFLLLFAGLRFKGFKGWLKSFIEPIPVVLPFKILDYFIRPLSLCFRQFGNIVGAFIIMELVYAVMPAVFPGFLSIYFDLFDGILQAYVFVFLTSLYVAEAIE